MPQVNWRVCELTGRHFRWRIRGNPLSWMDRLPADPPDRILATSMVDLATLRGLNPHIAHVPACYYFHENQFAYPPNDRQVVCVEPQMVQLYGALAAQRILFNSAYNRDSCVDGVDALLRKMPDAVPEGIARDLAARAEVLPIPIPDIRSLSERNPCLIVWNHRWEYDKAPEIFVGALTGLARDGVDFRLALLGRRPADAPASLRRLRRELGGRIVVDGELDTAAYRRVLGTAAIVVSTAIHEFQGLAVMEAAGAGCRPLVPDALCYREQYPAAYRYPAGDSAALRARLRDWLTGGLPAAVDVTAWREASLLRRWECLLRVGAH
jgi:glycosyltransferase involved in cell wall biosynthesis